MLFTVYICFSDSIFILFLSFFFFFFFKQKTAYELRISDWSSDVCSSDLLRRHEVRCRPDAARRVDTEVAGRLDAVAGHDDHGGDALVYSDQRHGTRVASGRLQRFSGLAL